MKTPELSACHEFEALLPAYVEHGLPAADADRVAAHLATCSDCQQQVTQLRALTYDLDAALPEVPRTALRANFMVMLEQQKQLLKLESAAPASALVSVQPGARAVPLWPAAGSWLRVAASVVLVAVGVLLGRNLHWGASNPAGVAATGNAARRELVQSMRGATASDRIQLVTSSSQESAPGDPTVQVLLNTLNFDASPNVRLATCEALYRLRDDPRVREGLVQSLAIQTDPNVQITLIDMVVAMRVRRAVPQLERLSKRADALPVVRAQAEAGIGKLI